MKRILFSVLALASALLVNTVKASALPIFAHRYGYSCQACHTVVPHLNAFGEEFLEHGYRIAGLKAKPAFPLAIRTNLAFSSDPDPTGLPKGIVDEVEGLLGGAIGPHLSYFFEQYLVDGGRPGSTRDAWVSYSARPFAERPFALTLGSFTLPLPVEPETFRDSAQHYAIFDQTVGNNPFNFFDDKIGTSIAYGNPERGSSATFALLQGHDRQSGLQTTGLDTMLYAQHAAGPLTLSAYRYGGTRALGLLADRFWRQGYGLSAVRSKLSVDAVVQTGNDTHASAGGNALQSSGGFLQLRYEMNNPSYFIYRLDGTNDPTNGFARSSVFLYGRRFSHNTRFTVENDLSHTPRTRNTMQAQLTIAY